MGYIAAVSRTGGTPAILCPQCLRTTQQLANRRAIPASTLGLPEFQSSIHKQVVSSKVSWRGTETQIRFTANEVLRWRRCEARSPPHGNTELGPRVLKGSEAATFAPQRRVLLGFPGLSKGTVGPSTRRRSWRIDAAARDTDGKSYYEVLGIPQTADDKEIKKAYRRMALKYHPDVNKEKNAEAVFVRIKQAYTTLSDSKSRSQYDAQLRGSAWGFPSGGSTDWDPLDPFGYKKKKTKRGKQEEEEFYGLGEFFRDLQKEVEGWQSERGSSDAPKSLWEEMAEVGEEFVEFLEQELGLDEKESKQRTERRKAKDTTNGTGNRTDFPQASQKETKKENGRPEDGTASKGQQSKDNEKKREEDIDDLLASLKKEMGL